MEKALNRLQIPFYIIVAIAILWVINQYRESKLNQRLTAMQIKALEKQLGYPASESVVDGILSNGNVIEKVTSKINI